MKRVKASLFVFGVMLGICAVGGCQTSPATATAYAALDDGYRLIKPLAEQGADARNLPPSERAFIQQTIDNHARLIAELRTPSN